MFGSLPTFWVDSGLCSFLTAVEPQVGYLGVLTCPNELHQGGNAQGFESDELNAHEGYFHTYSSVCLAQIRLRCTTLDLFAV